MSDDELARLRAAASRDDYGSMSALARALHGRGVGARDVLRDCYGVRWPDELFAIAEAREQGRDPPMLYTNQPWNLAIPLDRGGPAAEAPAIGKIERQVLAHDPALVPLVVLQDPDYRHGDSVVCYRLDELAAGRATAFGLRLFFPRHAAPERYGDSLVAVMRDHFGDAVRRLERELAGPRNRGAGSIDERDVAAARTWLAEVEDIARTLPGAP